MKNNIRNIGIFAHIDAGKTTFTERILYESGELSSPGSVEEGTTEMDSLPEEISRGISITASTSQIKYKYKKETYLINIIDTPGHLDFHSQVDSALLAVDIGILLIDVTTGIRSQTEMIARKLLEKKIPVILFLNKIDKSIEFEEALEDLDRLFPTKKVLVFNKGEDGKINYIFNEKSVREEIELSYIEWSSELTDKYFTLKDSKKVILNGLREGFSNLSHIPIFAGSGLKGEGVIECLDFISSVETKKASPNYSAIIFKKQIHPILGRITYIKTVSTLKIDDVLFHGDIPYKLTHLYTIIPGGVHEQRIVSENSIVAFLSPSGGETDHWNIGDYLWLSTPEEGEIRERGEILSYGKEFIQILEPEKEEHRKQLHLSILDIVWEDAGLDFSLKTDTGQFQIFGMGELHLEVSIKRLESFMGEKFNKKNLQVSQYGLLNINKTSLKWEHHSSDAKYFSHTLNIVLHKSGSFENKISFNCKVSNSLKNSIESAFFEICSHVADNNPILGLSIKVESIESPKLESEHSNSLTKVAIIAGLKNFIVDKWIKIGPKTSFEIFVPHSQVGTVISLLQKRNAKVEGMEANDLMKTILKGSSSSHSLLGFSGSLRNITKGKAAISLLTDFSIKSYSEVQ
jgi:elongation factor G